MGLKHHFRRQASNQTLIQILGLVVSLHGLYIITATLFVPINTHHVDKISDYILEFPLLIGLGLIYLGGLLRRRKRTAWLVTLAAYFTYLLFNIVEMAKHHYLISVAHLLIRGFILPIIIVGFLLAYHREYFVKSDIQGFGFAARISIIILLATFIYGVAGFTLLDDHDFHQEINLISAAHYTVDQFNLTTNKPLRPYTKRAHLFVDSLSIVSAASVIYVVLSLFQPLRVKFTDHSLDRDKFKELLDKYGGRSEEFFKLWPHDKQYFFEANGQAALAFHVTRGVALCASGPIGDPRKFDSLMQQFINVCFGNDWLPALVHVEDDDRELLEDFNFGMQKLGQEAVVDIDKFNSEIVGNKYFRQIGNRFKKNDYSCELLSPPHHDAVVSRLKVISDEWLSQGGRDERGFLMGYFTEEYIQNCQIMVGRDAAGTIQAFINVIPAEFDKDEATYDMLRHTNQGLGNINDYILMNLISHLAASNYKRLNLGLCALVGLNDEADQARDKLIDSFLNFAYINGDRFYSFQGLKRFKAKYDPEWRDRYLAYQNGKRGFARTISALMRAMKV